MNFNNFTWGFKGKREAGDTLNPRVSIHMHPLKDDWWESSQGSSIASTGELVNSFFDLYIAGTTSFHVFFKNNEYLSGDFSLAEDVFPTDEQSCHSFYPDSISIDLRNKRHIKGKRILCNYHLLENCDSLTYRRVAQIRSTLEGGRVLPGLSQLFFVFFENKFDLSDITRVYWKYRENDYLLENHQSSFHVLQEVG